MAPTIWAVFLFAFAIVERSQSTLSRNISFGSYLFPTRKPIYWLSPSGHFAFGFYPQGRDFAVGIYLLDGSPDITVVWTTYVDDPLVPSNATLGLTKDGELVLTGEGGLTRSFTKGRPIYSASMFDNGNFVLYGAHSEIIWQSFDYPTDTILSGQFLLLLSGKKWLNSSVSGTNHTIGRFSLSWDQNYGLSLTPAATIDDDSSFYWTNSYTNEDFKLNLDDNGHMYVAKADDTISLNLTDGWLSSNHTPIIYRATLDQDGVFRLYSHSIPNNSNPTVEVKWQAPDDKCSVNGICGINSYCMGGEEIHCTCLPGFNYTSSSERSAGCEMRWDDPGFGSVEEKRMTPTIVSLKTLGLKLITILYYRTWREKIVRRLV